MAGRKFTKASAKGRKFVTPTKVDLQKRAALSLYATPTLSMVNPLSTGVARPLTKAEIAKQQADAKAALAKRALPTLSRATPKLAGALTATQKKPKGGMAREFVIPMRGFTDEETKKAKPTLKETAIGGAKFGAEILGGVMSISNLIGDKTGLNKLTGGNSEMADKISAWAEPETAGEAKSMRGLDIATLGFGGLLKSASKSARILAKADDAAKVIKELKALGLTPNPKLVTRVVAETDPDKVLKILTDTQKAESALLGASRAGTAPTAQNTIRTADGVRVPVASNKARFTERVRNVVPEAPIKSVVNKVRDTDELATRAANFVKDYPQAVRAAVMEKEVTENTVAIASEYIKKQYADFGRATDELTRDNILKEISDVTERISAELTKQGRTIQAASILTRQTPAGQLRFLEREIDRLNNMSWFDRSRAGRGDIPKLTPEEKKAILDQWGKIQAMPDGMDKAKAVLKFKEDYAKRIPSTNLKKFVTLWRAGLLTGLKTTGLNIASNTSHFVTEVLKDIPGAAWDRVAKLVTGKRALGFGAKGTGRGFVEGAKKGWDYLKGGIDERNIGDKLDYSKVNYDHEIFNKYTDFVFRAMGSTDQPFYYGAYARSMFEQAVTAGKNNGLKGDELIKYAEDMVQKPTDAMVKYAITDATTAVFQHNTAFAQWVSGIQKSHPAMEFLLPFAKTPSNVAMQIINYAPTGFIKPVGRVVSALWKANKGRTKGALKLGPDDIESMADAEKALFDQRLFSQEMGRATLGTAFLTLGYQLAKEGLVSASYPVGDERTQELNKVEGRKANAILINGKWRSPLVLGPAGIVIMMGAHYQGAVETEGSPTDAYLKTAGGVWRSFLEQTFLTSINAGVQAMSDPDRFLPTYVANMTASAVPTLVSDVGRAIDPYERRASTNTFGDEVLQKLQLRIPFLRELVPKDVDVLGRTRESVGNVLEILMDPSRPSPATPTAVSSEIRRLQELSVTAKDEEMRQAYRKAMPLRPGDKNGYESFDQKQNRALWKIYGESLNKKLEILFSAPGYQALDDEMKAKGIEYVAQSTSREARALMVADSIRGLSGQELANKLIEHRDSGVLTEDVWALMSGN